MGLVLEARALLVGSGLLLFTFLPALLLPFLPSLHPAAIVTIVIVTRLVLLEVRRRVVEALHHREGLLALEARVRRLLEALVQEARPVLVVEALVEGRLVLEARV